MEELNIKELFYEFWQKKYFVLIMLVLGVALGMLYSSFLVTPMYRSVTTLVLSNVSDTNNGTASGAITQNDLLLNQKLVSTYGEIMKSRTVAKQVIEKLGLKISEDDLINSISVQAKKDTELLEISVSNSDPKTAADIANTLAEVFTEKVKEVYQIENVTVIDKAEMDNNPYNVNMPKTAIIFAFGFLIISCLVIFAKVYFNNTIKTPEEIEKALGLPVLAVIPKFKD